MAEIHQMLTSALDIHLNLGQKVSIDTPTVSLSIESLSTESIGEKEIRQVAGTQIRLPSTIDFMNDNVDRIFVRVSLLFLEPLERSKFGFC